MSLYTDHMETFPSSVEFFYVSSDNPLQKITEKDSHQYVFFDVSSDSNLKKMSWYIVHKEKFSH